MTEQEKLHRAKHYIDSLANGVNPLDGTAIYTVQNADSR